MRIASFLQTPFISYENKNMIYIKVEDWDFCNPYEVSIFVDQEQVYAEKIFAPELSAMVPCYEKERVLVVRLTPFEDLPIESEYLIAPPKHWKIPLLYSSHEDLGYCAYVEKLHYECYEYLKKAMELCLAHSDFRYMIEHYWWLDAFDTYASNEEKELLKKLFLENRIELNGVHSGVHTSWANSEQLVRQMYFSTIEAKEKYETSSKCAFYADLSGADSSIINAYADMGIKYVGFFANSFRNCRENHNVPPIFWWEDKTGKSRLLLWHQRAYRDGDLWGIWCDTQRQYNEGEFYFDKTKMLKTEKWLTQRIASQGDCEYDIFPISFYDDRELPTTMLLTVCEEMSKKWKYPKFRMEIPSVFMQELETKFGDKIPTLRGEISDQWADFATISPQLTSQKRELMRLAYNTEVLSTLNSLINKADYDEKAFRNAYFRMCEFDEHCWATSSKHPQAMHRHNINKVKKEPIEKSKGELQAILDQVCPPPKADKISVLSTIPAKRKSRLRTERNSLIPRELKHQILPDDTVITEPIELKGIEAKDFDSIVASQESREIQASTLETDFYRVQINRQTKKLTSIFDKELGVEHIDKQSKFDFAQLIYVYTEHKTDPSLSYEAPKILDLKVYEGDLAYVIVENGYEEQSGAIVTTQLTIYKNEREIDIDISYKNALALIGDFYDRYKKNYFIALPFKLDKPDFYTDLAVGERNLAKDVIPLNANDFSVAQGWVAVENKDYGVAVYTKDMPVFHLGKIKYNKLSPDFFEDKGHVFLHASSNRCNNLIYTGVDDCQAKYHLSVLPYKGKHNEIVPPWSNEKDHSLILTDISYERLLTIKEENVRLVGLKRAQDTKNAITLRFIETAGKETDCTLELFFKPTKVTYATNNERDLSQIPTNQNTIHFKVKPYSYTTIKVYGTF